MTIIEILLFSAISAGVMLWASRWLSKPGRIQQKLQATLDERRALRATDFFINDIKQIIPGSFHPPRLPEASSIAFQTPGDEVAQRVGYEFRASVDRSDGMLFRVVDGTETVVATGLVAPTPERPLFGYDPVLRLVTLDLHLKQPHGPPLRVVRRAALPN